jgi:hypothetical protein
MRSRHRLGKDGESAGKDGAVILDRLPPCFLDNVDIQPSRFGDDAQIS